MPGKRSVFFLFTGNTGKCDTITGYLHCIQQILAGKRDRKNQPFPQFTCRSLIGDRLPPPFPNLFKPLSFYTILPRSCNDSFT
jgi:hypothetical protein